MYTIIICALIAMVSFSIHYYISWDEYDFDGFMISVGIAVVGALVGVFVAWMLPVKYELTKWNQSIVSIKDNSTIQGSFFLGCGNINGRMKYVYYSKIDDTYQMHQVDYYDAYIRYSDEEPKVEIIDNSRSDSFWNNFSFDTDDESYQKLIFYIPNGSIKNEFQLDAE